LGEFGPDRRGQRRSGKYVNFGECLTEGQNVMLFTPNINTSATRPTRHRVTPKVRRAFQAADCYRNPTVKKLAAIAGVSTAYVNAALKADFAKRLAILNGNEPLVPAGNHEATNESKLAGLAARLARLTPDELAVVGRELGVEVVWDGMISPSL
jgi:hypothetical protein